MTGKTTPPPYDDQVAKALADPDFTKGEKLAIMWQNRMTGGFQDAVFMAISLADDHGREALAKGFPDEVEGWEAYYNGTLKHKAASLGLRRLW